MIDSITKSLFAEIVVVVLISILYIKDSRPYMYKVYNNCYGGGSYWINKLAYSIIINGCNI